MFNNPSNPASGKGENIIILFSEPTLADALLPQAFKTSNNFSFRQHLGQKASAVQAKKIMQKLSDSSLKMENKSVQFQGIFNSVFLPK